MPSKKSPVNMQDAFLSYLRRNRTPVTIFFINNTKMRGVIKAYDQYIIIFESDGVERLVYKHAISFIKPDVPGFKFSREAPAEESRRRAGLEVYGKVFPPRGAPEGETLRSARPRDP